MELFINNNKHLLTDYEILEIKKKNKLNQIYYLGVKKNIKNKKYNNLSGYTCFYDNKYNYKFIKDDHIDYRYKIIEKLGSGSFGIAVLCYDFKYSINKVLKINKCNPNYNDVINNETNVLKYIKNAKKLLSFDTNKILINYYNSIKCRNHIITIFEEYDLNLYQDIKINNVTGYDIQKCKNIVLDLSLGLEFLNTHKIIHKDLKPENIVFTLDKKNVVIIDFGLSKFEEYNNDNNFYIQSRYYRAPEVIFEVSNSYSIDIWSLGTIMYEIYTGYALLPGSNNNDMVVYLTSLVGLPPVDYIKKYRLYKYFDKFNYYLVNHKLFKQEKLIKEKSRGFAYCNKLKKEDDEHLYNKYVELYKKIIVLNVEDRYSIYEILCDNLFK